MCANKRAVAASPHAVRWWLLQVHSAALAGAVIFQLYLTRTMISVVGSWVWNSWQSCHTQLNQWVSGESLLPPKRGRGFVSDIEEDGVNSIQRVELRQQFMENRPVHRGKARSHHIFRDDRT